jgi:hypothetical protein
MSCTYRELYGPAHFGNSYEAMGDNEATELFAEARWWGFTAYGDWPDAADLRNPDGGGHAWLMPQALMERKVRSLLLAQRAGLETNLVVTPNHVWMDQVTIDNAAVQLPNRMFGQLICPSKVEARRLILENHKRLFNRLYTAGITLNSISFCPYDYGGCACPNCAPWILTFGHLARDIIQIARGLFPTIRPRLVGWWWTAEDHVLFNAWAGIEEPGLFCSLSRHVPYGATAPGEHGDLPRGCDPHLFIHIGYPDQRGKPSDCYGPWGPMVAGHRLPQTLDWMAANHHDGFVAYSEGISDDVNKAIVAGIGSGLFSNAEAVLRCYAERYFGASNRDSADWAHWLADWSDPFARDLTIARRDFDKLSVGAKSGWRLDQFACKLRLFETNEMVHRSPVGSVERQTAKAKFASEQERLYRDVWGLGLVRHVLHPRSHPPLWSEEYSAPITAEA